jgi:hypothetical protein
MEYIMRAKQLFALTALTLAAGAVLADEAPGAPLTRAEVVQSVLAARAAGTLAHAGPVAPEEEMEYARAHPSTSTLTRADEKADIRAARADGTLRHAGEIAPEEQMEYAQAHPSTSTLTRAEVKAEVLEARANGTLTPAGEGEYPAGQVGNPDFRAAYAANRVASPSPSATIHASK